MNRIIRRMVYLLAICSCISMPLDLVAQDCGVGCASCGIFRYEGVAWHPNAPYSMFCNTWSTDCDPCPFLSMGESSTQPSTIQQDGAITASLVSHAEPLVAVEPRRGIMLLFEPACFGGPGRLVRVIRVDHARAQALLAAGVIEYGVET